MTLCGGWFARAARPILTVGSQIVFLRCSLRGYRLCCPDNARYELRPEKHFAISMLAMNWKRTKSHVFGLPSTLVRSASSKIFPIIAVALLRVTVQLRIGASRRR